MSMKYHIRIFIIATLIWLLFLQAGMPDYFLQYSTRSMILFVVLLLIPIFAIILFIFRPLDSKRRLTVALWYAFYFTIPLLIYDSIYCGLYLGYGIQFITEFWFLSVYYVIPWILFPLIAVVLNRKYN
jgi:uncharacterized membrane protein